jgi:hypothetical protein
VDLSRRLTPEDPNMSETIIPAAPGLMAVLRYFEEADGDVPELASTNQATIIAGVIVAEDPVPCRPVTASYSFNCELQDRSRYGILHPDGRVEVPTMEEIHATLAELEAAEDCWFRDCARDRAERRAAERAEPEGPPR